VDVDPKSRRHPSYIVRGKGAIRMTRVSLLVSFQSDGLQTAPGALGMIA